MKTFRHWIPLLLLGISGLFTFTLLSGTESLDSLNPQADKWQTLSGEWRESNQAESFLRQVLEKSGATALSVAVVQGSDVVFQRSMGIVDEKTNRLVDERTVFRTASLSKPVFAYLAMTLVNEGLLDVDKPLHQYLERPLYEYPDYKDLRSLKAFIWPGRWDGEDSAALKVKSFFT